jgi:hypothetical protein
VDAGGGLGDLASAWREWALEDPQRYLLIYGTPVPGYQAPEDTTRVAAEVMGMLLDACGVEGLPALPASSLPEHLADHRAWAGEHGASPVVLQRALMFWTRMHGVLSLELAGHFAGMGFDPAELYEAEVEAVAGVRFPRRPGHRPPR